MFTRDYRKPFVVPEKGVAGYSAQVRKPAKMSRRSLVK